MARLNLWREQSDDGKQLLNPTASIQIWSVRPLFSCPLILSCHLWFIPSFRRQRFPYPSNIAFTGRKKVPLQPTGGQQSCQRDVFSTVSPRACSGPPAVSGGRPRIGQSRPAAAPLPPCPGTAGSSAAPGR